MPWIKVHRPVSYRSGGKRLLREGEHILSEKDMMNLQIQEAIREGAISVDAVAEPLPVVPFVAPVTSGKSGMFILEALVPSPSDLSVKGGVVGISVEKPSSKIKRPKK